LRRSRSLNCHLIYPSWIALPELALATLPLKEALENPSQSQSRPDPAKTIRWRERHNSCCQEYPKDI
jgi:hypothetical protein